MSFMMTTQKEGRVKYLLLALVPWMILSRLTRLLPRGTILDLIYVYLPLAMMCLCGYFLILKKNHSVEVCEGGLIEQDWRGKYRTISIHSIRSSRRN